MTPEIRKELLTLSPEEMEKIFKAAEQLSKPLSAKEIQSLAEGTGNEAIALDFFNSLADKTAKLDAICEHPIAFWSKFILAIAGGVASSHLPTLPMQVIGIAAAYLLPTLIFNALVYSWDIVKTVAEVRNEN